MANLYTRKGDQGETCLVGGMRVEKDNPRVQCYGTIDEVNSVLGLAYASCDHEDINEYIKTIQQKLFVFGAELASDKNAVESLKDKITDQDITDLEHLIDKCTETIGIQKEFVVPGVNQASASLHIARTILRKAEREMITLNRTEEIRSVLICYANRLSDALYALARLEEDYVKYEIIKLKVIEIVRKKMGMENKNFDLKFAKRLAVLVEQKAKEINVPCVFTAVDAGGNIILHERMDGALLGSLDISKNKAYTAVAFKMPTSALAKEAMPGGSLYGIQNTNENKTVIFGGGYPYKINGEVVGGIGISGGTVEEDMIIAEYALKNIGGNM
ncbi:MAG: cob(I)yrinic acid a,c-diamide adenosyltransferase [Peptostreptococcaceae bacterium]|nr:cob(I)yrinic acid a,c-diamide adenosyltransferase [Peptostreptococcaceae bacterium]